MNYQQCVIFSSPSSTWGFWN